MCGIFGFNWDEKGLLDKMQKTLRHRGPDSKGYYTDSLISLGNCRLAIIDLKKGRQPIHNEDYSVWVSYNGEVYNYKSLRENLEAKGHKFYTDTDTEVIVHSYEEYGEHCPEYLNGMFAFAIYDSKNKQLFLARDRLGIKPLYYYVNKKKFMFASEIKAILQCEDIKKEVNFEALNNLLTFRYISGEASILKNIHKLLPGHYLIFKNGRLKIKQYWDIKFFPKKEDEKSLVKELDFLLENSVEKMLNSDVPLGIFISGGIDSSTITYYASKKIANSIRTFTLGFSETDTNEFKFAKIIADTFNTDHTELLIEPSTVEMLPQIIWQLDEPLANPTVIPSYMLAKEASKHVRVILSGEGSDEIFAGYEQHKIMKTAELYKNYVPKILQKSLCSILNIYSEDTFFHKLKSFSENLDDPNSSYVKLMSIFDENEKRCLYSDEMIKKIRSSSPNLNVLKNKFENCSLSLNQMLLFDIKNWLPNDILLQFDKMTMANSLEGRVPFLDNNLVNYSTRLTPDLKLKGLNEKYILKKTMHGKLPKKIVARKKQRFPLPLDSWFSKGIKEYSQRVLDNKEAVSHNFFNKRCITKLLDYQKRISYKSILRHNSLSKLYYPRQLWTLVVFELWYRIFIEGKSYKKL